MPKIHDWIKETVTGTPGAGTITLGGAAGSYCQFEDQFTTGDLVLYSILDGENREQGVGTLTTGTPWTLSRDVIIQTLVAGVLDKTAPAAISLTSAATVQVASSSKASGVVLGFASNSISTVVTCNAATPVDDTPPLIGEGVEVITVDYTPLYDDSLIVVDAYVGGTITAAGTVVASLHLDTGSSSGVAFVTGAANDAVQVPNIHTEWVNGDTTTFTMKLRCGVSAGIFYVNGDNAGGRLFGAFSTAWINIKEIRQ